MMPKAQNARNFTQCDSLLIGDQCGAHTVPYIESPQCLLRRSSMRRPRQQNRRGSDVLLPQPWPQSQEDAVGLIVNGFCKDVLKELPMEFAVEAQKLLAISLEGSVG